MNYLALKGEGGGALRGEDPPVEGVGRDIGPAAGGGFPL
jgi:hypothetical protein